MYDGEREKTNTAKKPRWASNAQPQFQGWEAKRDLGASRQSRLRQMSSRTLQGHCVPTTPGHSRMQSTDQLPNNPHVPVSLHHDSACSQARRVPSLSGHSRIHVFFKQFLKQIGGSLLYCLDVKLAVCVVFKSFTNFFGRQTTY